MIDSAPLHLGLHRRVRYSLHLRPDLGSPRTPDEIGATSLEIKHARQDQTSDQTDDVVPGRLCDSDTTSCGGPHVEHVSSWCQFAGRVPMHSRRANHKLRLGGQPAVYFDEEVVAEEQHA